MTCYDIYLAALTYLGEAEDTPATSDYKKRAPFLLAGVLSELYPIHKALGGEEIEVEKLASLSLDCEFMLNEHLLVAASMRLACLLIFDERPELSAELEKRTNAEKARVSGRATSLESIGEVYGI